MKKQKKILKYFKGLKWISYVVILFSAFTLIKTLWISWMSKNIDAINIDNRDGTQTSITLDRQLICLLVSIKLVISVLLGFWGSKGASLFRKLIKSQKRDSEVHDESESIQGKKSKQLKKHKKSVKKLMLISLLLVIAGCYFLRILLINGTNEYIDKRYQQWTQMN